MQILKNFKINRNGNIEVIDYKIGNENVVFFEPGVRVGIFDTDVEYEDPIAIPRGNSQIMYICERKEYLQMMEQRKAEEEVKPKKEEVRIDENEKKEEVNIDKNKKKEGEE